MIAEVILGVALAAGFLGIAALGGLHRERAFYAALLLGIPIFYVVFAAQASETEVGGLFGVALQAAFCLPFAALAITGFRTKRSLIAAGLALHAVFDVVMQIGGSPAPAWWAGLCLSIDGVLALAVLYFAPGREALRRQPPAL